MLAFALPCPLVYAQAWNHQTHVFASDGADLDDFGSAQDVHGDTLVVGARFADSGGFLNSGAAYLFERDLGGANAWGERIALTEPTPGDNNFFGWAVAVYGDTVAVGGGGNAYIFERDAGGPNAWGMVKKLEEMLLGVQIAIDASLALSGDTLLAGTRNDGSVFLYDRDQAGPGNWGLVTKLLTPAGALAGFGFSVSCGKDVAVVGAPADSTLGTEAGAVYVFERNEGGPNAWGETQKLFAGNSNPVAYFGGSVANTDDAIVAGAIYHQPEGAAFVFERGSGGVGWVQTQQLTAFDTEMGDDLGWSVAIFGDTIVVGAPGEDELAQTSGAAYVFERDWGSPGSWAEAQKLKPPTPGVYDRFGEALSAHQGTIVVGAPHATGASPDSGAAFVLEGHGLPPTPYCTAGVSASGCQATISAVGIASSTAVSGFDLIATSVEGTKDGLFFYGTNGRQAKPWGNGTSFNCVVPPVKRGGLLPGTGTAGFCDGTFTLDLNARWCPSCPKPPHNPGLGATVQAQLWYRDPFSTDNQTTSFSDATEFLVGP